MENILLPYYGQPKLREIVGLDEWDNVCKQSLNFVCTSESRAKLWREPVLGENSLKALDVIVSRCNNTNPQKTIMDIRKYLNQDVNGTTVITPEILYALYLKTPMDREIINKHIASSENGPEQGLSASRWKFPQLVDLSCIPLFRVEWSAIIPGYEGTRKEVVNKINGCYSKGLPFKFKFTGHLLMTTQL